MLTYSEISDLLVLCGLPAGRIDQEILDLLDRAAASPVTRKEVACVLPILGDRGRQYARILSCWSND